MRLYAAYLDDASKRESIASTLRDWLNDAVAGGNKTVQLIAALVFIAEDNVKEAFRAIKSGANMEQ